MYIYTGKSTHNLQGCW